MQCFRPDHDGTLEWVWRYGRVFSRMWVHVHEIGLHHVPHTGPVILAGNHRSHADIPAVVGVLERRVNFAATEDLLGSRVLRFILESQRSPIVRHSGLDRQALDDSLAMLRMGRAMAVFPEGELKPDGLDRFEEGAAYLAVRTGAPLIPFGLAGTLDAWSHKQWPPIRSRHVAMVIAPPLAPRADMKRRDAVRELNARLHATVERCVTHAERIRRRATGRG